MKVVIKHRKWKKKDTQHNGQIMISKTLHRKLKIEQRDPRGQKNEGEPTCSGSLRISCFTIDTRRVTIDTNHVICHQWGNNRIVIAKTEQISGHL